MTRFWVQKAIRNPGSLREWFKRNRKKLTRHLHYDPLKSNGEIKKKAVEDVIRLVKKGSLDVNRTTLHRLYLAKTLFKLQREKEEKHKHKSRHTHKSRGRSKRRRKR